MLFPVEKFRMYLEHLEFDLETDNLALSWCLARPRKTGRLARWTVRLSAFKFVPHHIKGSDNVITDSLSRMFQSEDISPDPVIAPVLLNFPTAFADVRSYQAQDPVLSDIVAKIQAGTPVSKHFLADGILYCNSSYENKPKIVFPQVLIPMVFQYYLESTFGGHLGIYKTRHKIPSEFIWSGMDVDIRARVKACQTCALSKPAQNIKFGYLDSRGRFVPYGEVVN